MEQCAFALITSSSAWYIKRDSYPILCTNVTTNSLEEATVFATLDANSDFWQVETYKQDRDIKAFTSLHRIYGFVRMLFKLRNHPGTFEITIDVILFAVK